MKYVLQVDTWVTKLLMQKKNLHPVFRKKTLLNNMAQGLKG